MRVSQQKHALELRINSLLTVALSFDLDNRGVEYQRGILLIRTLLCCALMQLHSASNQTWHPDHSRVVQAAVSAAELLETVDVSRLVYVDPVMGVSPFAKLFCAA